MALETTRWGLLDAIKTALAELVDGEAAPLFSNVFIVPTSISIKDYDESGGNYPVCFIADLGGERAPENQVLDRRRIVIISAVASLNDKIGETAAEEIHVLVDAVEDSLGRHTDFSFSFSGDSDSDATKLTGGKVIVTKALGATTTIRRAAKAVT